MSITFWCPEAPMIRCDCNLDYDREFCPRADRGDCRRGEEPSNCGHARKSSAPEVNFANSNAIRLLLDAKLLMDGEDPYGGVWSPKMLPFVKRRLTRIDPASDSGYRAGGLLRVVEWAIQNNQRVSWG